MDEWRKADDSYTTPAYERSFTAPRFQQPFPV